MGASREQCLHPHLGQEGEGLRVGRLGKTPVLAAFVVLGGVPVLRDATSIALAPKNTVRSA